MSNHLKRLTTPRIWKIPKKEYPFAPKPSAGPHASNKAIPLVIVLRDMLHVADNRREARKILAQRLIKVDGKVRTDSNFPVGFMDVITVGDKHYRAMYDIRGNLRLVEIPEGHASWKLARVENKTVVKGGKIVLNLHDGRNIMIDENKYRSGDVLKIKVPTQEIIGSYSIKEGSVAMIIGGTHRGQVVHIKSYTVTKSPMDNVVSFEEGFETLKRNVFVVGVGKPEVTIPEVSAL